jgi:hypothetical protein
VKQAKAALAAAEGSLRKFEAARSKLQQLIAVCEQWRAIIRALLPLLVEDKVQLAGVGELTDIVAAVSEREYSEAQLVRVRKQCHAVLVLLLGGAREGDETIFARD